MKDEHSLAALCAALAVSRPGYYRWKDAEPGNAVALVRSGRTVTEVARDLGVSKWSLGRSGAALRAKAPPFGYLAPLGWQSDFTCIETAEGWLFLAFTLDACTRRCVAHHCRSDLRGELTTTTLALALQRQPPPPGLLHHSDRGVQYAAAAFAQLAADHGLTLSMSRTANPYDNALAESFVATLKTECFGTSIPLTRAAAELMAFDYIETFYNRRRRHSSLGHRSPLAFEKQMFPPKNHH